jgi:release factor glutamine methyltransferase
VFAEDEAALLLGAADGAALEDLVVRRMAGEPLEHLLGWVEFAGRRWSVGPGVFVPRRRTELMVRTALGLVPASAPPSQTVLVDLCCGCGAIGGAVLAALLAARGADGAVLHASDVEPAAVDHARRNLDPLGGSVTCGDLFDPLPAGLRGRVDVLAANAPYVPTDQLAAMPREARDHERATALDGGSDGVELHRRIAAGAPAQLRPGGVLVIESSRSQATLTGAAMAAAGLVPQTVRDEELDGTVVVGRRALPS